MALLGTYPLNTIQPIVIKNNNMKHALIILALCFAIKANSQSIDTVKNAIQVKPMLYNALVKDTAYQVSWTVLGIPRKDTSGANSYVQLFDRKAKSIGQMNIWIPNSIISIWLNDTIIDDYILKYLGLQKK
jgi:hypothetical protein